MARHKPESGDKANKPVSALLDDLAAQLGLRIEQGKGRPVLVGRDGKAVETWREDFLYAGAAGPQAL